MRTLLIGYDSAWTAGKYGALVAALRPSATEPLECLGTPVVADFPTAAAMILRWQTELPVDSTLVLLDQPTIVSNQQGQRPVEHLISSPVSRRRGGVQPANRSRTAMFGGAAPLWAFLERFGGAANPVLGPRQGTHVIETYPVATAMAMGWTVDDDRSCGRLAKYNPERRRTFSLNDWAFICGRLAAFYAARGLPDVATWLAAQASNKKPRKANQDQVDACLCLVVAILLDEGARCSMVGEMSSGYIVFPHDERLVDELRQRCHATGRRESEWIQEIGWTPRSTTSERRSS